MFSTSVQWINTTQTDNVSLAESQAPPTDVTPDPLKRWRRDLPMVLPVSESSSNLVIHDSDLSE